jgi:chorismate synthase
MLRFLDAGESHGRGITSIVEGLPRGVPVSAAAIADELARRRLGYGRSARMELERDHVEILAGVRSGITLGSPVAMLVMNAEYEKWKEIMPVEGVAKGDPLTGLRPGHADLAGALKYDTRDLRDVLERASARETVGRVCAGSLARMLLGELEIAVHSHVLEVGGVKAVERDAFPSPEEMSKADDDEMRCLDAEASILMREEIDRAREAGDSLGGIFEVGAYGLLAGLGSHAHWDRRLDARLAAAVMAIQAVKGVEIGRGFDLAGMRGSEAADAIRYNEKRGFYHTSNMAGGLEGGMTNGEIVVIRAAMKPIPTLSAPLDSVDVVTKKNIKAAVERADICAVPAAAVIAEATVAFEIARALLEKTGGDSLPEIKTRYEEMRSRQAGF